MPFVAPNVDVVLKPLIQKFCLYLQSIGIRFSSTVFLARFRKFFTRVTYKWSIFLFISSLSLGGFSLIKFLVFLPFFSTKFRRFFHQLNTHSFLFSFSLGLEGIFYTNKSHDLKCWYICQSLRPRGKVIIILWGHMTSHIIDLIWLG